MEENIRFCTECGFKMDKLYSFCPICGAKVDSYQQQNQKQPGVNSSVVPEINKQEGYPKAPPAQGPNIPQAAGSQSGQVNQGPVNQKQGGQFNPQPQAPYGGSYPPAQNAPKKKKNVGLIIAIVVLVFLLVASAGVYLGIRYIKSTFGLGKPKAHNTEVISVSHAYPGLDVRAELYTKI